MKLLDVLKLIERDYFPPTINDKGEIDSRPQSVFQVTICFMCEEETWMTCNIQNLILVPWYDCEVLSIHPDSDNKDSICIWLKDEEYLKEHYPQHLAIKALEQKEIWNATTKDRQIIAPKGTFRKIWEDEQQPCEDCISRKEVRRIESSPDAYPEEWNKDYERGFFDAIKAVLELPSVTPQQTRWIPVSEKLPEEGRYLVYIVNKHDANLQYIMTADFSPSQIKGLPEWFPDNESADNNVVAWMPLPEPYKAESEDEE